MKSSTEKGECTSFMDLEKACAKENKKGLSGILTLTAMQGKLLNAYKSNYTIPKLLLVQMVVCKSGLR